MLIIARIGGFLAQPSDIFGIGKFKAGLLDLIAVTRSPVVNQAGNSFPVSSSSTTRQDKEEKKSHTY